MLILFICDQYLKEATEGSWGAFIGMARLRAGLIPCNLAVASRADLEAGNNQFQVPQVGILLP